MITEDTLPKLLLRNYQEWGDSRIAMRRKDFGIWEVFTWKDVYEKVKYFALAMICNGFEPGDKISTLGDNDPELFWAELAAQSAGGAMTGIFSDCLPEEVKYQAWHSDSKFIVARDQEQIDKVINVKDELPLLKKVIYWDPKGLANYEENYLISFNDFLEQGREYEKTHPGLFEERIAATKPDDVAVILYTSGTTGLPKGAIARHSTIIRWAGELLAVDPLVAGDNSVSFTLPGWIVEQLFGYGNMLLAGTTMNFPEELETVQTDLREVAPSIVLYASRLWERLNSEMQVKINDSSWIKRLTFRMFAPVGYRMADLHMQKKKPNILWKFLYKIAYLLLFRPLLDKHGLTNVKYAYTAGAILGPDIFRFFRAMGINIKQMYGITEIGIGTLHRNDDIAFESVGTPLGEGRRIVISEEGEILVDAAHCFDGYYKNEEAYQKATRGGWFHTGDAGNIDERGHLIYIDRVADLKTLSNGIKFSPQYIESSLKFSPYIIDALVLGEEVSDFVGAIVNLDFGNVGKWAEDRNIPYTTFTDLSQKPEIRELIRSEIDRVNRRLPEESRIRKFINLHKEFDPDEAELTRTRKIRRDFMEQRYGTLISAIYSDKEEITESATVTYQDGRKGTIETSIKVNVVGD